MARTGTRSGLAISRRPGACTNRTCTPALSRYSTRVRSTTTGPPAAAWLSASWNLSALLMSISPTAVTIAVPSGPGRVESSSEVAMVDPQVQIDGRAGWPRLDGDLLHESPHQRDAVPRRLRSPGGVACQRPLSV